MILNYKQLEELKKEKGGLAVAFGCFDILHKGHINFLEQIRELSPYTVAIGVLPDEYVKIFKGASRPIFNENDRTLMLDAIKYNEYTFTVNEKGDFDFYKEKFNCSNRHKVLWEYCLHLLYTVKPTHFYFSTDFVLTKEISDLFAECNIKAETIEYTKAVSTTAIIDKIKNL